MNPHYFSSLSWVFFSAGPTALTEQIKKGDQLTISHSAKYKGSATWMSNPSNIKVPGILLVAQCLGASSSPHLNSIFQTCFHTPENLVSSDPEGVKVLSDSPAKFVNDVQYCILKEIYHQIQTRAADAEVLEDLNRIKTHFESGMSAINQAIASALPCSHDKIQYDWSLENFSCGESELPSSSPHYKLNVRDLRLDFKRLCRMR